MAPKLNPRLLDVVGLRGQATEGDDAAVPIGTVVELIGENRDRLLVEIADETGVSRKFISVPIDEVDVKWRPSQSESADTSIGDAQRSFEAGVLLLQNGLIDSAKTKLVQAFKLNPRLAGTLMNSANDSASKHAWEVAIFVYELIIELQPKYMLARQNLGITFLNRGVDYANRGAIENALSDFNAAMAVGPSEEILRLARNNFVAAYTELAIRHIRIRRYQEALAFFMTAFQLDPSETPRKNYATSIVSVLASQPRRRRGIPEESTFRQPMLMGLSYSECLNAYGATLGIFGELPEAMEILERAVRIDPNNTLALQNIRILSANMKASEFSEFMWGIKAIKPIGISIPVASHEGSQAV